VGTFKETVENALKNPSSTKKTTIIEGIWRLDAKEGHQFETNLKTESAGEFLIETDETIIMGGRGIAPNPVQVFIAGFLACYSATFAKWAAMEGVELKNFKTVATVAMDLATVIGISDTVDILENMQIDLFVESDASLEKLNKINEIVKKRGPGYYCVSHAITPQINLTKK
jgi:uncharacterized OsmC-like protein